MAKLQIEVGADIGELKDKLAEAQLLLEKLKKQKVENLKIGLDVKGLQTQINDAKANINGLTKAINTNSAAQNTNSRATANGSSTLTQFSRIAQDAPFGIIGIGNNLTATAESFGYLAQSSGGAGNALKAVGASLLGPGGILLAISLVTTGLTVMAQKGITISDVFNKLSGNFNEAASEIKKAYETSTKSALGEVASIKAVIQVAQDEKVSRRERLAAVNELQSKYPAYFGNLSKEQILYGDLSKEIKDVAKALIDKAAAEKISEKAGDAVYKELQLNAKLIKAKQNLAIAERDFLEAAKDPGRAASVESLSLAVDKSKQSLLNVRKEIEKNNGQLDQYEKILNKITKTEIGGKANEEDAKAAAEAEKQRLAEIKRANEERRKENLRAQKQELKDNKEFYEEKLKFESDFFAIRFEGAKKAAAKQLQQDQIANLPTDFANLPEPAPLPDLAYEDALLKLKKFNSDANEIINGSVKDTFAQLGYNIGSALATGGNVLKAAGGALLSGLGSVLIELGRMAIQVGAGILAVKMSLKTLNPYLAIAAGIGLVALGSVFSSKAGSLGGSMGSAGGSSGGGSQRGSMSTGADIQTPTSSVNSGGGFSNNSGTVVFEISGQKLIGVLSNTLGANKRLGGSLAIG
jgi:hypothetical protein